LRNFAFVAGAICVRWNASSAVRAVYMAEHRNNCAPRSAAAADAVRVFTARFGEMPYKTISVVDAPLVAGLGARSSPGSVLSQALSTLISTRPR
jgi:galactokinase/mevalonate kinase-like predicted kinase